NYRRLLQEREAALRSGHEQEKTAAAAATAAAEARERLEQELAALRTDLRDQTERLDALVDKRVDDRIADMSISRRRFEQLAQDRAELVELLISRLYALSCWFAHDSAAEGSNRGLFMLLVDRRNMDQHNFSDFHEGQAEYIHRQDFQGIELAPHVFSPVTRNVLDYMGAKDVRLGRDGEIVGYEERDGAVLVDLQGMMYRSRQMVEGVRTHKVYSKVERLMKGSARHNAAIYASSLDEVLVSIVASEETNQVTVFRDGKFVETYDPHTDEQISREQYFGEPGGEPSLSKVERFLGGQLQGDPAPSLADDLGDSASV
ncbi:MAG: hypothetical protein ABGY41_09945, partial [Candidatus Poribacteria bacterium]